MRKPGSMNRVFSHLEWRAWLFSALTKLGGNRYRALSQRPGLSLGLRSLHRECTRSSQATEMQSSARFDAATTPSWRYWIGGAWHDSVLNGCSSNPNAVTTKESICDSGFCHSVLNDAMRFQHHTSRTAQLPQRNNGVCFQTWRCQGQCLVSQFPVTESLHLQ